MKHSNAAKEEEESAMFIEKLVPDSNQETEVQRAISSLPENEDAFNFYKTSDIDNYVINYTNDTKNSLYIECLADRRTTSHIFKDVNMFTDYHLVDNIIIGGVGGTKTRASGRGMVTLLAETSAGTCKIKLKEAIHVLDCKYNLISLGRWEKGGRSYHANNGALTLYTMKGTPTMIGKRRGNHLYWFQLKI